MQAAPNPAFTLPVVPVPVVDATPENLAGYGLFLGGEVHCSGLSIPFYKGSVTEGHNLDFAYTGRAVIRTARIHKRSNEVAWLERHLNMTQLFVGLGEAAFVLVLGKPTHARGLALPDLADVVGFRFRAGHGILLHRGTWHDFPMAWSVPVTILTANSDEVVSALAAAQLATEMDHGDVFKIDIAARLRTRLEVQIP